MQKVALIPFALALAATPAVASDIDDAMKPVHQFIDNMDKGDMQAAGAAYASSASIIDEFAPYHWDGNAFAGWGKDFETLSKSDNITKPMVKLGKVRTSEVTGDHAYIVVNSVYSFEQSGKPMHEPGCYMTFALEKVGSDWKIASWAWTRPGKVVPG